MNYKYNNIGNCLSVFCPNYSWTDSLMLAVAQHRNDGEASVLTEQAGRNDVQSIAITGLCPSAMFTICR